MSRPESQDSGFGIRKRRIKSPSSAIGTFSRRREMERLEPLSPRERGRGEGTLEARFAADEGIFILL
jgi:hypothetical protein